MLPAVESHRSNARFADDLQNFIGKYAGIWRDCPTELPTLNEQVSTASQQCNERETDLLIDAMETELRNYPGRESKQEAWRKRIFGRLRQLGTTSFQFPDKHLDIIFSPEYLGTTREFVHQARAFDGAIAAASLGQALRNVWVMNCLQMFLGRRPSLSPSIFAYSMLYPSCEVALSSELRCVRPHRNPRPKKITVRVRIHYQCHATVLRCRCQLSAGYQRKDS